MTYHPVFIEIPFLYGIPPCGGVPLAATLDSLTADAATPGNIWYCSSSSWINIKLLLLPAYVGQLSLKK